MTRRARILVLFGAALLSALAQKQPPREEEPPEEDPGFQKKEYAFNPLQAAKDVRVGNFYFKKGSYTAAAKRFEEATRWNPSFADAWLRLGDAREKMNDDKGAKEAYAKYLELAADSKQAPAVKKKLGTH